MHVRYPLWLRAIDRPGAASLALLFALESSARALLSTVITLQGLAILQSARDLSLMFALVGVTGVIGSFAIPLLIGRLERRRVYTLGALLVMAASALLALVTLEGQLLGMLVRVFGVACLSITTSLYIMQYINKRDLTRSEPMRLQVSAIAWTVGPAFGVFLYKAFGPLWTYGLSMVLAGALLAYFWFLRLGDNPVIRAAKRPPPSPLGSIGRFVAQPRLRLAWLITFGRSCWWVFFFVYAPVYMVQSGQGETDGALLVSAGNAMLFLTPIFGSLGRRYGLRRVLSLAYLVCGAATLAAALFFGFPLAVALCMTLGALCCVALDAVGNIPFLRAVHPYERAEMTTVFRTYIDASELLPPLLFALVLSLFDLRAVFVVMGLAMVAFALWPRFLPRRM